MAGPCRIPAASSMLPPCVHVTRPQTANWFSRTFALPSLCRAVGRRGHPLFLSPHRFFCRRSLDKRHTQYDAVRARAVVISCHFGAHFLSSTPTVLWAQRSNTILLTVEVSDIADEKITLEESKISFSAKSGDKQYAFEIEFHGAIKPDVRRWAI